MIKFTHKGDFKRTDTFLGKLRLFKFQNILKKYGQLGCEELAMNTPMDSGETASSWDYKIEEKPGSISIIWTNSNINDGVPIAVILQYGHGTNNGGYVQGIDYINPTMKPIFDKLAQEAWEEVTK